MPELMERNPEVQQEYEQRKERTATLTNLTLQSTDGPATPPTPTQEENDLLALGLMHPDDKAPSPPEEVIPPPEAQRAYLLTGAEMPKAPARAASPAPRPAPPRQPEPDRNGGRAERQERDRS